MNKKIISIITLALCAPIVASCSNNPNITHREEKSYWDLKKEKEKEDYVKQTSDIFNWTNEQKNLFYAGDESKFLLLNVKENKKLISTNINSKKDIDSEFIKKNFLIDWKDEEKKFFYADAFSRMRKWNFFEENYLGIEFKELKVNPLNNMHKKTLMINFYQMHFPHGRALIQIIDQEFPIGHKFKNPSEAPEPLMLSGFKDNLLKFDVSFENKSISINFSKAKGMKFIEDSNNDGSILSWKKYSERYYKEGDRFYYKPYMYLLKKTYIIDPEKIQINNIDDLTNLNFKIKISK
nr:hypothetical protein [Mycoplasmopsis canis]WQQ12578.1 hypothetical protein RRG48_00840 [Mycoplasmopsis canis]